MHETWITRKQLMLRKKMWSKEIVAYPERNTFAVFFYFANYLVLIITIRHLNYFTSIEWCDIIFGFTVCAVFLCINGINDGNLFEIVYYSTVLILIIANNQWLPQMSVYFSMFT